MDCMLHHQRYVVTRGGRLRCGTQEGRLGQMCYLSFCRGTPRHAVRRDLWV